MQPTPDKRSPTLVWTILDEIRDGLLEFIRDKGHDACIGLGKPIPIYVGRLCIIVMQEGVRFYSLAGPILFPYEDPAQFEKILEAINAANRHYNR